jgi:diguanylate cyclase (GGDEF)-like protein
MRTIAPTVIPTVLMVDDNADFLDSTVRVLRAWGVTHPLHTATNAIQTINAIHALEGPAILFVDLNLRGRTNGSALLRYARSIARHPVVAFYLSSDEREDVQAAALKAGGSSGFLVKPVHPERLIAHIAIGTEQIENILGSTHDVLTGTLLSRKEFDLRAMVELERASRSSGQTAGIFADIDEFKAINTNFGHLVGDRVIRGIASCFQKHLRHSDSVCRYGGDEIFMLLPETTTEAAHQVASRIDRAVRRLRIDNDKGGTVSVTISLGVAFLQGEEIGEDPAEGLLELERRCDRVMYQKKAKAKAG